MKCAKFCTLFLTQISNLVKKSISGFFSDLLLIGLFQNLNPIQLVLMLGVEQAEIGFESLYEQANLVVEIIACDKSNLFVFQLVYLSTLRLNLLLYHHHVLSEHRAQKLPHAWVLEKLILGINPKNSLKSVFFNYCFELHQIAKLFR